MSLGTRLDSPSAIGDEGRPRATSLWIATLVTVALVGVGGSRLGEPSLLPSLATVVGATVAGVALLDRDRFVHLVVGHALLVPFGSAVTLLVLVAPLVSEGGLAVAGFATALFGIALTWADAGNEAGATRAAAGAIRTQLATLVWLSVGFAVAVVVGLGWSFVLVLTAQTSPALSTIGFLIVVTCTAGAVLVAERWLPTRQLAPRDRRPAVEARLATVRRGCAGAAVAACGLVVVTILLWLGGVVDRLVALVPPLGTAFAALSSAYVVGPIAAVGVVALGAGLLAVTARTLTRQFGRESRGWLASAVVGVGLAIAAFLALLVALVVPPVAIVVVVFVLLGPTALAVAAGGYLVAVSLDVLPDRAAGPAVAAIGLVVAAVGFALGSPAPPLVFACVAGAVLVWDVSTYGLGVTAELGHIPETRRLELVHGVLAVGVAVGAVALATGLEWLRSGLLVGVGGTVPLFVAVLGVLVLVLPIRG